MALIFRQCGIEDIDVLRSFARQCFFDTFAGMNTPADMTAYLDSAFSRERLAAELSEEHSAFFFLYIDEELVGYLKLNEAPAQTDIRDEKSLEIERIYVSKHRQNAGLGKYLLERAVEIAAGRGKDHVWLGVWEKNEKALRFYLRNGFYDIGTHSFFVGVDEQIDRIMRKDLRVD